VVSELIASDLDAQWTAAAAKALATITTSRNVLLVVEASDERTWLSARNLPSVHILAPGQLNTYDVLISDDVVFTQGALEAFLAGPAKGRAAKASATSTEAAAAGSDDTATADSSAAADNAESSAAADNAESSAAAEEA